MNFLRDLRHAFRTLIQSPGYALMCVAVLALGIGANAAIFTVVYSVILQPLPYPQSDRLVFVWEKFTGVSGPMFERSRVRRKNFIEWQRQNTTFSAMAPFASGNLEETSGDHPVRTPVLFASSDLFPLLGARATLGRLYNADDERGGLDRVAVISDAYFERRFRRDPSTLGKAITLGGNVYVITGVLPPKFHLPATSEGSDQLHPDVWIPLSRLWTNAVDEDKQSNLLIAARLKPGVSVAAARTEMAGIARRLEQSDPKMDQGWTAVVYPFATEDSSPTMRVALFVLLGAVGFLLLIACANLANLTLARATARSHEIAVRLALGAGRGRVISQLASESILLSGGGVALGLMLAAWSVQLMMKFEPPDIPRPESVSLNLAVFGFAALAGVLTTLLVGLIPSIGASRADLNTTLRAGGARGGSAARVRSRQFLIVAEVALALILVSGAGLMLRSFQQLISVGIGFDTSQLWVSDIELSEKRYPDPAARSRVFRQVIDRARAVPGVLDASVVDMLPLHSVAMSNFLIAGRPEPPVSDLPIADDVHMSPGYFKTIGLRLEAGRPFNDTDLAVAEKDGNDAAIVNQAFARKFFPNENPLGKRLLTADKKRASEIVGVVSDYRPIGVENGVQLAIFWPYLKVSKATLVVRTKAAPQTMTKAIQNAIWSVDKDLVLTETGPMAHFVDEWQSQRKFNTLLLGIFAGLALVLAMLGIYGVLSNLVASRTREIGIRMAIGATGAQIGKLVLGQSMIPVSIGIAAGLAGSLALTRFLESLLFQVRPQDPLTLALAVAAILLVSPAALYLPLRRATRVECTVALREE